MRQGQPHRLLDIISGDLQTPRIRRQRRGGFVNHQIAAQAIDARGRADVGDRPR
jgi:hypothetical protein